MDLQAKGLPSYIELKKKLRTSVLESKLLQGINTSVTDGLTQNSRFNLFTCLDLTLSEQLSSNVDVSDISSTCFSVFSALKKEKDDLFDVEIAVYTSLVLR